MRTKMFELGMCAGLLLGGGVACADKSKADTAETQRDAGDKEFLDKALGVNQLELQLGQLAAQRATSADIKAMGQKMVEKHTEFGQQLVELARKSGGSGKAELSSDQRAIYDHVASQSGTSFDSVFKQVVDDGHVQELAMYREEVSRAKSPALKELAQRRVTKLEETVAQSAAPAPKPKAEPKPKKAEPSQDW